MTQGHNMWAGFFKCSELVEFVLTQAGVGIVLDSPQNYQVVQRTTSEKVTFSISGRLGGKASTAKTIEYRLTHDADFDSGQKKEQAQADFPERIDRSVGSNPVEDLRADQNTVQDFPTALSVMSIAKRYQISELPMP